MLGKNLRLLAIVIAAKSNAVIHAAQLPIRSKPTERSDSPRRLKAKNAPITNTHSAMIGPARLNR